MDRFFESCPKEGVVELFGSNKGLRHTKSTSDPVIDSRALFFQNFLEPGEPVYRMEVVSGVVHQVATLADLLPADALDYRLVALAPGDHPIVSTQSSSVNIYSLEMK
jgi:hypothetical protein